MLVAMIPAGLLLVYLGLQDSMSHQLLVGETIEQVAGPTYFGLLSNLTLALWAIGAAGACMAAAVLMRLGDRNGSQTLCILILGLWTFWLCFDDAYVLHESVVPDHLGISEPVVLATYVAFTLGMLVVFRQQFLNGDTPLLLVAMAMFVLSQTFDLAMGSDDTYKFVEESAKFLGVTAWAAYLWMRGIELVAGRVTRQAS